MFYSHIVQHHMRKTINRTVQIKPDSAIGDEICRKKPHWLHHHFSPWLKFHVSHKSMWHVSAGLLTRFPTPCTFPDMMQSIEEYNQWFNKAGALCRNLQQRVLSRILTWFPFNRHHGQCRVANLTHISRFYRGKFTTSLLFEQDIWALFSQHFYFIWQSANSDNFSRSNLDKVFQNFFI